MQRCEVMRFIDGGLKRLYLLLIRLNSFNALFLDILNSCIFHFIKNASRMVPIKV